MKQGSDVSKWNTDFDLAIAKGMGESFVIIRAGYGAGRIDPKAEMFYQKAREIGIQVGFYWFSYATTVRAASLEADALLTFVQDKKVEYPLVFDYEGDSMQGKRVPYSKRNAFARAFCSTIESEGYYTMVYTNKDWLNHVWDADIKKRYGMWVAHYGSRNTLPNLAQMWQYTNSPRDMNFDVIGLADIIKKRGLNHLG